jgi:hypothetical protein
MRTALVAVLLAALAVAGCASSEAESQSVAGYDFGQIDRIAVVEVTGRVYGEAAKDQIANLFMIELMKKGYKFVARKDIKTLLKEQEFQASDITSPEGAAKAGQILNVPAVMLIDIPKYQDEKMDMSAKLIDVEDGTILWIGTGTGNTGKTLATLAGVAAGAALGAAVGGHDTNDRVIGGVIGGVVGGVAGNALSPDQEKQVKKVVVKVLQNFPSRIPQVKPAK